jgi:diadenosine tetraphosphatase ApaH/serine/threonine PP2A family protein phosphatase
MKYAFFSDVHANLEALKAVVVDFQAEKIDKVCFLGDAVGYGPNPNECIELINEVASVKLIGNHDYAALGLMETDYFNQYAAESMNWTRTSLKRDIIEIMKKFEIKAEFDDIMVVHSSPKEPEMWHYILDMNDVEENFRHFNQKMCLVGHTHRPFIVSIDSEGNCTVSNRSEEKINPQRRYLVNIGSVGQPRDGDPRSCYLIYDCEKQIIRHKRVAYSYDITQKQMASLGLPEYLIERLAVGR